MIAPAEMTALERLNWAFPSALTHRVTVYVPSTVERDKPTNNVREVQGVALLLSRLCGGATACPCRGWWMPSLSQFVVESPTLVWANVAGDVLDSALPEIWAYCEQLAQRMGQDAISLEVDGVLYYVEQGQNPWNDDF